MALVAYMLLAVATAPSNGVGIGLEFERFRACIREHRSEIRRPSYSTAGTLALGPSRHK